MIGHVRRDSLEVEENKGVIYRPMAQQPVDEAVFVVRTKMNPDAMRDSAGGGSAAGGLDRSGVRGCDAE